MLNIYTATAWRNIFVQIYENIQKQTTGSFTFSQSSDMFKIITVYRSSKSYNIIFKFCVSFLSQDREKIRIKIRKTEYRMIVSIPCFASCTF